MTSANASPSGGAPEHGADVQAAVEAALEREAAQRGALLPVLHAVQEHLGYVPASAVPLIAKSLNLSRAEVHGVISFYHDFRSAPAGRHVVRLCLAEACQSMGAHVLRTHVENALRTNLHSTASDGSFTLEPVYCLGNCACAPAMQFDGELYGRVTADVFDAVLAGCKEGA
jgi:formate dehydrogenase subunit gamma